MPNYYCTDEQLTDWLPTSIGPEIDTEAKRTTKLRGPASRWVDSKLPASGGFNDIGATVPTPEIIQEAATAYGLFLGNGIQKKQGVDAEGEFQLSRARDILQVDESGLGHLIVTGLDEYEPLAVAHITRDREDEADDESDVEM